MYACMHVFFWFFFKKTLTLSCQAAEAFLVGLFNDAQLCAIFAQRITIKVKDIQVILNNSVLISLFCFSAKYDLFQLARRIRGYTHGLG